MCKSEMCKICEGLIVWYVSIKKWMTKFSILKMMVYGEVSFGVVSVYVLFYKLLFE